MEQKFLEEIKTQAMQAASELLAQAEVEAGDILVVGCSSSEVTGGVIGKASSVEAAEAVFHGIWQAAKKHGLYLAAQCCEHLNRALIIEKELAKREHLEIVTVVPQPKAGGSFATMAYRNFSEPVAVEHIRAQAGIDIGDTLIGMHLQDVAIPVRLGISEIGKAHLVCAKTRGKLIGGERAVYHA